MAASWQIGPPEEEEEEVVQRGLARASQSRLGSFHGEVVIGGKLGSVEGSGTLGDRAPRSANHRMSFLSCAHEHVRGQAQVAHVLGEERVHRRGRRTMPARRLECERLEDRPRCRANGVERGRAAGLPSI